MTIAASLAFPQTLTLNTAPADARSLALSATWLFDPATGRYQGVETSFASPTAPVRATSIKTTPVRSALVPQARARLAGEPANIAVAQEHPPVKTYFRGTTGRRPAGAVIVAPGRKQLEQAAAIHRLASAIGDFSILAVARSFNLDHRQAARWVGRARRQGLLA